MQPLKKVISLLLSACVLFSATGLQGSIYNCTQVRHYKQIIFFDNSTEKENCCALPQVHTCESLQGEESNDNCCSSNEQIPAKNLSAFNERFLSSECCSQYTFYYQLELNTLIEQHKYTTANAIDFVAVELEFYTIEFTDEQNIHYTVHHPFFGHTLQSGKRFPILFSQFII